MEYSEVKNPVYENAGKTLITCDVKFKDFSYFVPFTASPDDSEEHGRQIYNECQSGEWGLVSVYVAPVVDWQARAEEQRQSMLAEAYGVTADWRTELELGVITEEDKSTLIKWMAFIKAVKALDFSAVKSEKKYSSLNWPASP